MHFHVRRLSVCSHEILSSTSNRYTVWNESGLCVESQPLRLELLLVCVFKNKCAYHIKNSEQTVTISSHSCHNSKVLQIFHRGEHAADLCKLLTTVNSVNSLFCLEHKTIFCDK